MKREDFNEICDFITIAELCLRHDETSMSDMVIYNEDEADEGRFKEEYQLIYNDIYDDVEERMLRLITIDNED